MNEVKKYLDVDEEIIDLVLNTENELKDIYEQVDKMAMLNSMKVINAFWKENVSEIHFNGTSGYGYSDVGREVIEKIFADILGGEASLVRNQFISGTHALTVALFALLRPKDKMLIISGEPYHK